MVVDSSVFLEIFSDGKLRAKCERLLGQRSLSIPSLVLFEVYRKLRSRLEEFDALDAVAALRKHQIVDLTSDIALTAADLSLHHKLAVADSLVLAHARELGVPLVTLDNDFAGIEGVTVIR